MAHFRIHSLLSDTDGRIPYMVVSRVDNLRAQFLLGGLDDDLMGMTVCLNLNSVYSLLEGKTASVELPFVSCKMTPAGEELEVCVEVDGKGIRCVRKLGLAELALAWNMMSGFNRASISMA